MSEIYDQIDRKIIRVLQKDSSLSQREVADQVGMSQNACWRRMKALRDNGVIIGQTIQIDPTKLDLNLTVFVLVRTRFHSSDWLEKFRAIVSSIPNIIDFYRIAGDYDYMIKVIAKDMNDFDEVYQSLISRVELDSVTSYMTMESIISNRELPV